MFCQNETLCTFDVLKRDDAASPDAFQLNNSKKKKKKKNITSFFPISSI